MVTPFPAGVIRERNPPLFDGSVGVHIFRFDIMEQASNETLMWNDLNDDVWRHVLPFIGPYRYLYVALVHKQWY